MSLASVSYLAFNFGSSVGIIFVNKALFASAHFTFTTALTTLHYAVNCVGLALLGASGAFKRQESSLNRRLLLLCFVVGVAPALNNLSLKLNGLGFYQVAKLLVTPVIVCMERVLYGKGMSAMRACSLLLVCVGVGVACVNDVSVNLSGCLAALAWVPVAAVYKVLWSRIAQEERWSTLALMNRVLPLSMLFTLMLCPLIDPPGLFEYEWTARRGALVALSGAAAFFVNWSGFLVMGACSALTHTILGQLKACVIIVGGWAIFGQSYPTKSIAGAALAIGAIVAYTYFNLHEAALRPASPAKPDEEAPADTKPKCSPPPSAEHLMQSETMPLVTKRTGA
uniref:Sugar phosphate transporter domain-containing protein n=1 Tax=Calcidiscus leptoporus TaxID=127549 RepID=A0A7S0ILM0_9EUKA|mmetsp:Transcript_12669/g.29234  ORF Transcript_12669/g.29234 Transcript_12669/m.29234 type:complete len:339 (+) Transcript_12669:58-1074(+)|eukprot:CAMPEP_0119380222 /NCGR_PEP_ID=MMETSP1334-20130426/56045_1 /TAXON_ID=127549 /ORGANISM="Calcidiscus leptoporus, Strain RCC1130" /LENGTH=338 /DNA_ID=CAMNT_0007399967 /DNA_START=58 /DNA_END=1074 /DNA_ORIENTATION=-